MKDLKIKTETLTTKQIAEKLIEAGFPKSTEVILRDDDYGVRVFVKFFGFNQDNQTLVCTRRIAFSHDVASVGSHKTTITLPEGMLDQYAIRQLRDSILGEGISFTSETKAVETSAG